MSHRFQVFICQVLLTTTNQAIYNRITGSQFQTRCPGYWQSVWHTSATYGLDQDSVQSTYNTDSECRPTCQTSTNYIEFLIDLQVPASASARTFMPILSWSSTANGNFPTQTVNTQYNDGTWHNIISVVGRNTLVQLPAQVTFSQIIVRLESDNVMPLCLDAFFALEEFYLNPWIQSAQVYSFVTPGVAYTDTLTIAGSLLDTQFTQGSACLVVAPRGAPVTSTTITAYFDPNSLVTNSVLVSSIYVQVGQIQDGYPWSITIKKASWSGTAWVYSNQEIVTNSPGSQWYDLTAIPSKIVVSVQISSPTHQMQICTLKTFGYAYCKIQSMSLTYNSSPISSVALEPGQTITVQISLTYKIDDGNTIVNNPFCAGGNTLVILEGTSAADMSNVFLDPATMTATYTLPIRWSQTAFNQVFTFKSKDPRDSSAVFVTKTLNVAYGACQQRTLGQGQVKFLNGTSLSQALYYQGSGVNLFSFDYIVPDCNGFQPLSTQIAITVSYTGDQDVSGQSAFIMNQNLATWNECQLTFTKMCFIYYPSTSLVNPVNYPNSIRYISQGPSSTTNTFTARISIQVTFFGYDHSLQLISGSVLGALDVRQTSCSEAEFELLSTYKHNNLPCPTDGVLDLRASINDTFSVTSIFQASDSISKVQTPDDGMSWCGARFFTVTANQNKSNYLLAQQFLYEGCTSCLTLNVSTDGYTANITARIYDEQFTGQNFTFVLNLGVQNFLGQDDQQIRSFEFTLYVDKIKNFDRPTTALLFPQFQETPDHIVNKSCGDVLLLPNIIDMQDPKPKISFQFGQAASFMSGNQSQIAINSECLAGFYPVLIKLENVFKAISRYQFIIVIGKSQGLVELGTKTFVKEKISQLFSGPIPELTYNQSQDETRFTAKIASISHQGLVTIKLASNVLVPIENKTERTSQKRNLIAQNAPLDVKFLDDFVMKFRIVTRQGSFPIQNWTCVMFNESSFQVQLYFDQPFDISADSQDQLVAEIIQPEVFIEKEKPIYFFNPDRTVFLKANLPQQVPVNRTSFKDPQNMKSNFTLVSSMTAVAIFIYIILLCDTRQKSADLKTFVLTVQTATLIVQNSQVITPLSMATYFDLAYQTTFLKITRLWWTKAASKSYILLQLGGLQIGIVVFIIGLIVMQFIQWCFESRRRIQRLTQSFFAHVKWAGVINYYQLTFVNFVFAANGAIHQQQTSPADLICAILLVKLYQVLLIVSGLYVFFTDVNILERKVDLLRLGAFYYNTGTWSPYKRSYRTFTFAGLLLVSGIVVLRLQFYMQSLLLQLLFMANLIYLLAVKPHNSTFDSLPDTANGIVLLLVQLFQLWLSRWTLGGEDRYKAGVYFCYFCIASFSASLLMLLVVKGVNLHNLRLLYKLQKNYRKQRKFQMRLEASRQRDQKHGQNNDRANDNKQEQDVQLNDVFFSDGDDDFVIDLVERELQIKRKESFEIFQSSSEVSQDQTRVQESKPTPPTAESQLVLEPNNLIALKPRQSLFNTILESESLKLASKAKVQQTPLLESRVAQQSQLKQSNEIFESPRSQRATPNFSEFNPDSQFGLSNNDFDSQAFERAYRVVALQRKLEEKRRHAKDLSELPSLADYEELMTAEKLAHPQVIKQVKKQLQLL